MAPYSGWQACHLSLATPNDEILGVMPLYLKHHSMGEYVFDQSWAEAFESAGGAYYPKLLCASPFTPVSGARLLAQDKSIQIELAEQAKLICNANALSSVHVNFHSEDEIGSLTEAGFLPRQDRQYWWHNQSYQTFDQFLETLTANRRKVIRRERKSVQSQLNLVIKTGSEITETDLDTLYKFIKLTYDRKWGAPYLTREFFSEIHHRMAEKILLVLAMEGQNTIAAAINFMDAETLYGRQWGCDRDIPFLHFEVCYYQAIDYAIQIGLKKVEAGTPG